MNLVKLFNVPKNTVVQIFSTDYMESTSSYFGNLRACGNGQRVDIQSTKVIETGGIRANIVVAYLNAAGDSLWPTDTDALTATCGYSMTSASTSLTSARAAKYPGFTKPLVQLGCPSIQDCMFQVEVLATCVATTSTTTTTTSSPSPATTTSSTAPTTSTPMTTAPVTTAPTPIPTSSAQQTALAKSRAGKSAGATDYFAQGVTVVASLAAVVIAIRLRAQHEEEVDAADE